MLKNYTDFLDQELNTNQDELDSLVDHFASAAFQQLIDNPDITEDALKHSNGDLSVDLREAPSNLRIFKRLLGFKSPHYIPSLNEEQITSNQKFIEYKNILKNEGYEVEIKELEGSFKKSSFPGLKTTIPAFSFAVGVPMFMFANHPDLSLERAAMGVGFTLITSAVVACMAYEKDNDPARVALSIKKTGSDLSVQPQ